MSFFHFLSRDLVCMSLSLKQNEPHQLHSSPPHLCVVESKAAYLPEISPDYWWRQKGQEGEEEGEEISVLSDGKHAPAISLTEHVCAHVLIIKARYTRTLAFMIVFQETNKCFFNSKSPSHWTLKITCQVISSMCPLSCFWYCIHFASNMSFILHLWN